MERAFVTHVFCELVFCPCVLGISYSIVWITVWALSMAVIPPLNGIPLPMTLDEPRRTWAELRTEPVLNMVLKKNK